MYIERVLYTILYVYVTRSTKNKKRFIRNEKWTSPIFASFKEQTSPFFSSDYSMLSYCGVVSNKRTGYYIGLFGHYIRNYILFNKNI